MTYKKENAIFEELIFEDIPEGYKRELTHIITQSDVDKFAELTGDFNPVHVDEEFASRTAFGKNVVHGMLTSSFISTMIGMLIPGPGALWVSQSLEFHNPSFVGDKITVYAEVIKKSVSTRMLVLKITIMNQKGIMVVSGDSKVKMLEVKKKKEIKEDNMSNVVLVTGGSSGIGAAISRDLAKDGMKVVVNYSNNKEKADTLVAQIKSEGGTALAIKANIVNEDEVTKMFKTIEETFGHVNSIIHSASLMPIPEDFNGLEFQTIQNHFDVQVKGAFNCVQSALPGMIEAKSGSIVMIGSIFTEGLPPVKQLAYTVSKSALVSLAKSLAVELGPKGIRVNIISPGMTHTEMISNIPEKVKMVAKMNTPLRKLAEPEEIAGVAKFLISKAAGHITGESIKVCGGLVM
jgi:3-oxoacyl-[acyl-carrier protein] reductase